MEEKLTKAKYLEWQASLFGACGIALGLGVYFSEYLKPFALWLVVLGVILHSWGMFKIHRRNK